MALQGSLDTFALPDVLRLLATTAKTGRLRVEGDRGQGSVWLRDGTVMAAAADQAIEDAPAEEVLFELLRYEQGAFAFEADELSPNGETPEDVEILLRGAGALLEEWGDLEAVVPSLDHQVDLVGSLPKGDVTIEASRWPTIVAVASGRTVRDVASSLGLSELGVTRAVRDLVDLGVATVGEPDEPLVPAAEVPPEDRARRSPFGSLGSGEQLATSVPRETGETGWMQSPERATSGPSVPDGVASGVAGIGRSGTNGTSSGSPAPGLTPRSGRSGSGGKRSTSGAGSGRSSGSKRPASGSRSPGNRRDTAGATGSAGAASGGMADAAGSSPGESRRSSGKASRDAADLRRQTPAAGSRDPSGEFRRSASSGTPRDPSGEFRRSAPSGTPRDPSGEFRRSAPSGTPRDPSGEFRRPSPSSPPRDPSGEFRRPPAGGPGYESPSRLGKTRPSTPRRTGGPATPPPVLPDTGPLSVPPVSPTGFDAGPLGPSPLPADTGQIRPVSPNSIPADLQWAVDDQASPGVPPAGPLGGRGLGNGHGLGGNGLGAGMGNGNGAPGNGFGNGAGPHGGGVPLDPNKVAPHVAAMSPEARAAVQGTVGNTGGSSGGFGPGDDLASRGQLLNFLSSVRP